MARHCHLPDRGHVLHVEAALAGGDPRVDPAVWCGDCWRRAEAQLLEKGGELLGGETAGKLRKNLIGGGKHARDGGTGFDCMFAPATVQNSIAACTRGMRVHASEMSPQCTRGAV